MPLILTPKSPPYYEKTDNNQGIGIYKALLTQAGTAAPIPTVMENTIGIITFIYQSTGVYKITSEFGFPTDKTYFAIQSAGELQNNYIHQTADELFIYSRLMTVSGGALLSPLQDSNLFQSAIEIKTYN